MIQKRSFSSLASESSIRFDYNYIKSVVSSSEETYSYRTLFEIVPINRPVLDESEPFQYAEINHVSKNGKVLPATLSYEDRNELNEDLFKKVEKGDIFLPERGNILISTIRPYLNKVVLIDSNEKIYFTKAFIQIKPLINNRILYYLLRTIFSEKINAVSRQGKGYPTLKEYDLKNIMFPRAVIDNLLTHEEEITMNIEGIEKEIRDLEIFKKDRKSIINEIFSDYFNINMTELHILEKQSKLTINSSKITHLNENFRHSFRWNKMQILQDYLYKDLECVELLGKFIIESNNGWSPESIVGGEGTLVLGQESFEFDGTLNVSPTKTTNKTKTNIENFFIKEGDFFVSRGNTIDLVGLAGVIEVEVHEDIIYPDLYIRLNLNEKEVNKKYLALLFNSFFGRLYFKYVSKGKNQTMVKISSGELLNFYLPLPSPKEQLEIVTAVEKKISALNDTEKQIKEKQNQIRKLIEKVAIG